MKILISDDDFQIREGIRRTIHWENFGIDEVDTAADGVEAWKKITATHPDIILSDIKMPGMDGLELVKNVRKTNQNCRIIFISAYPNFEYCQQAMRLGADDYILKPIRMKNLEEVLTKVVKALHKSTTVETVYNYLSLEECYKEGQAETPASASAEQDQWITTLRSFGISASYYLTSYLRFKPNTFVQNQWIEIVSGLNQNFLREKCGYAFALTGDEIVIVFTASNSEKENLERRTQAAHVISKWNQTLPEGNRFLWGGISAPHTASEYRRGFQMAKQASSLCFYARSEIVCFYDGHRIPAADTPDPVYNEIIEMVKEANNPFTSEDQVKTICKKIAEESSRIPIQPEALKQSILYAFHQEPCNLLSSEIIITFHRILSNAYFLSVMVEYILHFHQEVRKTSEFLSTEEKSDNSLVMNAIQYIRDHYEEQLNQSILADKLQVSVPTLSKLFRTELGCSVPDFITKYRMHMAKEMALHTDMKINEIAERCGYTGYVYFSRIFHDTYGKSVSEIRAEKGTIVFR